MTDREGKVPLIKTLARWPVLGRHWRRIRFDFGAMGLAPEPHPGAISHQDVTRLAQRLADVSRRLEELDSAQTELFLQVRDLHARIAEALPSLAQLEHQINEVNASLAAMRQEVAEAGPSQILADRWISVREAARLLGVSPGTVRRYIAQGFLKAGRLPTRRGWRLLRSEVERLLSAATEVSRP
ncbi:MAG: helix-turn-helix domain-containing protein [Anaerolineae bacterium]|nr:helix-turn-helix domain-containing protein [Anaerolineae bacterium]MDW8098414.1 helix-turn-helix domain-containing protein [Anaerolineae bacterium]